MQVLWLPSWYPSKITPFNGDFVQRYAEAVSRYEEVEVIFVVRDEKGTYTRTVLAETIIGDQLKQTIIYYYVPRVPIIHKLLSALRYRKIYKKAIEDYIQKKGRPDIVHVQVGMNAGALALWLLEIKKIPFVLTEHWTGFLDEAKERFDGLSGYTRLLWKKLAKHALSVSFVSRHLLKAYTTRIGGNTPTVIPNAVNTSIFYPGRSAYSPARFIHISGLDERKNPKQILEAFKQVIQTFPAAKLDIFGAVNRDIADWIREMKLENSISVQDETPQTILADRIRESTALILYSNCETFGCVIIEANACGVPVIVSDIPVFHEIVKEGENGYFAKPNDPAALAERMIAIIQNRSSFDSQAIATMTGAMYSYDVVGKQISNWYSQSLKKFS